MLCKVRQVLQVEIVARIQPQAEFLRCLGCGVIRGIDLVLLGTPEETGVSFRVEFNPVRADLLLRVSLGRYPDQEKDWSVCRCRANAVRPDRAR